MDERLDAPGLGALIQRVRAGDGAALRLLVTRYGGSIYADALSRTGDPDRARAVAKATLTDILETPWGGDADAAFALWITRLIERNAMQQQLPAGNAPDAAPAQKPQSVPGADAAARDTREAPPFDVIWSSLQDAVAPEPARTDEASQDRANLRELWYDGAEDAAQRAAAQEEITDEAFDDPPAEAEPRRRKRGASPGSVLLSIILILIIIALTWGILGVLSDIGVLPPLPLGYEWFNENIYPVF